MKLLYSPFSASASISAGVCFDFSSPFMSFSFYINSSFCLSFCKWDAKLAQASAEVYFKPPIWLGSHKGAASFSQKQCHTGNLTLWKKLISSLLMHCPQS